MSFKKLFTLEPGIKFMIKNKTVVFGFISQIFINWKFGSCRITMTYSLLNNCSNICLIESIWPYVVDLPCKSITCILSFSFHLILDGKYNYSCLIDIFEFRDKSLV